MSVLGPSEHEFLMKQGAAATSTNLGGLFVADTFEDGHRVGAQWEMVPGTLVWDANGAANKDSPSVDLRKPLKGLGNGKVRIKLWHQDGANGKQEDIRYSVPTVNPFR